MSISPQPSQAGPDAEPRPQLAAVPASPEAESGKTISKSTLLAQALAANALAITALVFFAVLVLDVEGGIGSHRAELILLMMSIIGALLLNMVILRRQFAPLEQLVGTMEKIDLTEPGARAELPRGTTDDVAELVGAFNDMIERLEQERREKIAAAVDAQESERARVARDLHDEANQALTAVILRLEAAQQSATPELAAEINEAKRLATQAMEELLEVVRRLRPTILDLGLRNALSAQINDFGERTGTDARFSFEGDARASLGPDRELAVYRVVQEALSNIAQHADANQVDVNLSVGDHIRLTVRDDGRGFDPTVPNRRFGITGMRERALLMNGKIDIDSTPGTGTTLTMELP
ncbi:MAG: sensor histidine kinase [Actinobacteria bacterium]|nr:sensor histidine kinase [Actinomycetota bacterium]